MYDKSRSAIFAVSYIEKHIAMHNIFKEIKEVITRKNIFFSALFAVITTFICYLHNNMAGLTNENQSLYLFTQKISEMWFGNIVDYGDAVFVNVGLDRELVPVYKAGSKEPIGTTAITDRRKLYYFLRMLRKSNRAKYIILDLEFDSTEITAYDDSLFNEIRYINNIVIARDDSTEFPRPWLKEKSALAKYRATLTNTGFTRYEYLAKNKERYIPTKIYESFHPKKGFQKYGFGIFSFYFSGHSLCQNACFLKFDTEDFSGLRTIGRFNGSTLKDTAFYNLGEKFINPISPNLTEDTMCDSIGFLTQGRYVVIGNFTGDDNHDTFFGVKPGSLLIMRALQTLEEGGNLVSVWWIINWILIFFFISISIVFFSKRSQVNIESMKPGFWSFVFSLLSYAIFLNVCNIFEYLFLDRVTCLSMPMFFLSTWKLYYQFKSYKSNEG